MTAEGYPCCNNATVADLLGHFIIECNNVQLTKIREELRIKEFATQLTAEATRQQNNRNSSSSSTTTTTAPSTNSQTGQTLHVQGRTRVTRSAATSQADTMATLLVGRRLNLQSTGSTNPSPFSTSETGSMSKETPTTPHSKQQLTKPVTTSCFHNRPPPTKGRRKRRRVRVNTHCSKPAPCS